MNGHIYAACCLIWTSSGHFNISGTMLFAIQLKLATSGEQEPQWLPWFASGLRPLSSCYPTCGSSDFSNDCHGNTMFINQSKSHICVSSISLSLRTMSLTHTGSSQYSIWLRLLWWYTLTEGWPECFGCGQT